MPFLRLFASGLLLGFCASVLAQTPVARIRGSIEKFDGGILTIQQREGGSIAVKVGDKVGVSGVVAAPLAEVTAGKFVGIATHGQKDGALVALEVLVFPEPMRGTGEGHRPWDLAPTATMTNANVEQTVAGNDGHTLTMKYKDGEKKLVVTPETVVVTYAPGDRAELKPGTGVFISAAKKMPDGTLQTPRINYGRGGLMPPM